MARSVPSVPREHQSNKRPTPNSKNWPQFPRQGGEFSAPPPAPRSSPYAEAGRGVWQRRGYDIKLFACNGRELEVYDVSGPVYRLAAGPVPIKLHGHFLFGDEEARELVRDLARVQRRMAGEATAERASAQEE